MMFSSVFIVYLPTLIQFYFKINVFILPSLNGEDNITRVGEDTKIEQKIYNISVRESRDTFLIKHSRSPIYSTEYGKPS